MKVYPYYEVVKELIIERGGYSILDFSWVYDLAKKFRLQPFYAEGEIVEWEDDLLNNNHTLCYAEGEIVCGTAGIDIIGDMLIDYSE